MFTINRNFVVSMVILSIVVIPSFAFAKTFTDVDDSMDYSSSIEWMASNGVIEGYSDGSFGINNPVNRVEFLKMVYLTQGLDSEIVDVVTDSGFSDVVATEWYAKYVAYAKDRSTIDGYPDGTFGPGHVINRVEATKIISNEFFGNNAADYLENSLLSELPCGATDLEIESWYWKYAAFSCIKGLYHDNMLSGDLFRPDYLLTRGETAEMLYRAKVVKDNNSEVYNLTNVPESLVQPAPGDLSVDSWQLLDDELGFKFTLYLPPSWEYVEIQGIDSFVGQFKGDGLTIDFDHGWYSNSLSEYDDDPDYDLLYEVINGGSAKIVMPKSGDGFMGIHFDDVKNGNKLTLVSNNVPVEHQGTMLVIFRSIAAIPFDSL